MKLFKNRTVLGIFCIAVSLIICFAITPLVNACLSKKVTIVRFNRQVNEGEEITRSMLDEVEVGNHNLPENVIRNIADVERKYLTTTVYAGDYILTDKISDEPAAENKYLYSLNGEKQAMSITINTFAEGLSGKLKSGDIVLYKQVSGIENIFWGDMYLLSIDIDGEEYVTVKYIQKSEREGCVKLVSQNPHHADKDVPIEKIRALAFVKASIRMNSIR